jgi:acetolactate decarboxylase
MKYLLCLSTFLLIFSCGNSTIEENQNETNEVEVSSLEFTVEYSGALKNIMHKSDVSAYADLNDFKQIEHFYALGAVEGLKGEILVMDGVPYISSVHEEQLKIDNSLEYKASLLVNTSVNEWNDFDIDGETSTYAELEDFIAMTAEQNGIDVSQPFPFLLRGTADTLSWHVINWPEGDTEHTHEKHINSGLHGTHEDIDVEVLGFYSDSHHAIFTHHTTNMHLHFISTDKTKTGHVDGISLGEGMKLLLPKTK